MANTTIPPQGSGADTPFDNLVGVQLVTGGGLTNGNFEFTTSVSEKVNRQFSIGSFSDPISLENLSINTINQSRAALSQDYKVYPNYDLSEITNFTLYGSLSKRLEVSVTKVLNYFPAALQLDETYYDFTTGDTAFDILYESEEQYTTFSINVERIKNPFNIDFTVNAAANLLVRETPVSYLRDITSFYNRYSLFFSGSEYPVLFFTPSNNTNEGTLYFTVSGNPFYEYSATSATSQSFYIKPSTYYTEVNFKEPFDEVEQFLLNRLSNPIYTATFQVPVQTDSGVVTVQQQQITWPLDGPWNLDIRTPNFESYLATLSTIGIDFDAYKTNLISRFYVTDAFKEFDTQDQKIESVLQLYGRSFDDIKKFIDALAYMNSVHYNIGNDIPSQLLKNLAQTLGFQINVSPITDDDFLNSIFGNGAAPVFSGYSRQMTPSELNFQFYRNLILNASYLFKSKGTRRSIEFMLRLAGAPDALVEINEFIYLADQKININNFDTQYLQIESGTYLNQYPSLDSNYTYLLFGETYTAFTNTYEVETVTSTRNDFPVDNEGYPKAPTQTADYFFQMGSGWFESTPKHRSNEVIDVTQSVFTGNNPSVQTSLAPFTYGEEYFDRYRTFPYIGGGYRLTEYIDNRKSWVVNDIGLRRETGGDYNAYYYTPSDKLVLNRKNLEVFLNPSQGIVYDVWSMSRRYDYPIPNSGLTPPYPSPGDKDWTFINPKPKVKTFFEFAQTFWFNTINVRNRQYITDGKTGGYPTLSSIFWNWLESENVNIPNDNFNYTNLVEYVDKLGQYWIRLVEQVVPASTLWTTGVRFENSIFHRQKFVYRRQRGCQIVPVEKTNCPAIGNLFSYECISKTTTCPLYPSVTFSQILNEVLNQYLTSIGKTLSDCVANSLFGTWYLIMEYNNTEIYNESFYTSAGITSVPTNTIWYSAIVAGLDSIYQDGFNYSISDNTITIKRVTCNDEDITFNINIAIDLNISCN